MASNKGKLKRDQKELERLFNLGRYWDFLQGVEAGGLEAKFSPETGKAWRALVRSAFSSPEAMVDFFRRRREVASAPDLPDLRFFSLVERFLRGNAVSAEVAALKNLTPSSHSMAKRLLQWDDAPAGTGDIEALLRQFAVNPDQVTVKQMAVAVVFFAGRFEGLLKHLPDYLETLRKGLLKSSVAKKRRGLHLNKLVEMDQGVNAAAVMVPKELLHILLMPLLWRLSRVYEAYCRDDNAFALELAGVTPYLSSLLAGERWREVAPLLEEGDLTDRYDDDPGAVRKKIGAADFPEKVRLLRTLAATLTRAMVEKSDFESFDDFDDEDGHEERIRSDYLFLYKEVLAEIGRVRGGLAPREQRELAQVMGEILEGDFITLGAPPQQCAEYLQAIAHAGLLTTRLALASLMTARSVGNRPLREVTEKALKTLPSPDKGDILWIFKIFGFFSYPNVGELSPVIRLVSGNEQLLDIIVDLISLRVIRTLIENRLMASEVKMFKSLLPGGLPSDRQEMSSFRKGLKNFVDLEPFGRLMPLAESYPEGYMTEAGFKRMLAAQYSTDGVVGLIDKLNAVPPPPPPGMYGGSPEARELIGLELRATLELLKQHLDDLRAAPVGTLATLVEILEKAGSRSVEAGFLVRLSTLLRERHEAGEREVASLCDRVEEMTRQSAGKKARRGGRR
jgi:hypothetical protein